MKLLGRDFSKNQYKRRESDNPFSEKSGELRNGQLSTVHRTEWSEDVYITQKQDKEIIGQAFNFSKLYFVGFVMASSVLILVAKTAWLQIVQGEYYYQMAEGNRVRIERIEPKRGVIYDRNLNSLVRNKANFLLYLVPADLPDDEVETDGIIKKISTILAVKTFEEIKGELAKVDKYSLEAFQPLFVADNIEYENAMKLYLESENWSGVVLTNKFRREYLNTVKFTDDEKLYGLSFSHILGYTGKINDSELEKYGDEYLPIDYIGKMGIEYFWENELKGSGGKKQIEVDALGKEKKILGQVDAIDGHNLVLSIDTAMQIKLEEILIKQLEKLNLPKASAVVMNPNNGEVLAMVSIPSYNNNLFARGISQDEYTVLVEHPDKPLFNRAVSGEFPSGSTFKPIMAAAALQEKVVSEHTSFLSVGGISIGQWYFPDWLAGGHGSTDIRKAISQSVNTYFYYIGGGYNDFVGLGVDRIVKYSELFGLGSQTGIDLAGEADGFVPTKEWKVETKGENWYIGDTYHLSIGQGDLLVTPLQVAAYTSVFANAGKLYRPHLVKEILSSDDKVVGAVSTEPVRENFIDDYNMMVVRQGMRQTVTSGSGRRLDTLPITSAGKTGTAQWSTVKDPHAWYTGFAPYDNPELAFTVLIEEGKEGSTVCVPVIQEFLQWYYDNYKKEAVK